MQFLGVSIMAGFPKLGNPIWVYYEDIDSGSNVQLPKLIQGVEGKEFHIKAPKFDQFKLIKSSGELDGTFDKQQRSVHFYYRKKNWGEIQKVELFLYLKTATPQYDRVDGMVMDHPLPADFYVKTFERVATMNGEFWYQVNPDRWVKFDVNNMKVLKDDPYAKEQPAKGGPASELTILPLNHVKATVDYLRGGHLYTYDRPYGEATQTVANGQELTLVGRLNDRNGVTWYQTENRGFINAAYVRLDDENEE